jgi:multidrug efflux pump subunit AcrA (membrane-fusion protein)
MQNNRFLMMKFFWIILLASAVSLSACTSPSTPTPLSTAANPPTPNTNFLTSEGVVASAKVVPVNESQMSFSISSPVKEVLVKEGDIVKAGQVLMRLYEPHLQLSVTQAELSLKAAELDLVYWINRFDRPPERRQQARAETEQARTRLKIAQASFAQASLVAPFDATVVEIKVQPGEIAQRGQTVMILGDLNNMEIQTTDLSERDVPRVQAGQIVNIYLEALKANISGKVVRVSPISETVGGDVVFPVTIALDQQPHGLLWGMTAEVDIKSSQ